MRTYTAGNFAGETSLQWETPRLRFAETRYRAGQELARHDHERAHFCLVLEGEYVEHADSRAFLRSASSIHFQAAGLPHSETHNQAGAHFIIQIDQPLLHEAGITQLTRTEMGSAAAVAAMRIHALMKSQGTLDSQLCADLVCELLSFLHETGERRTQWVERGRQAIHETYRSTVRLSDLARDAHVHPVHFAQTFRKVFGCTVGDYQRRLRIHDACRMLVSTDHPISRIAVETGFADESHMSRCFRRIMLVPPGAYRRANRSAILAADPLNRSPSTFERRTTTTRSSGSM